MASNNFQVRVTGDTTKFDAAMNKAQGELRSFQSAAKSAFSVIGVTSFAMAIGSLTRTLGDFERANSELAAVLGTNLKGIDALTKSAKEFGRTTEYTASDVTRLQIALSRLGFDTSQIGKMQGAILDFALAMNTDLASAAEFAGAALRAFDVDARDTEELLDVLSAATTNSALDFSKLQASLSTVAPIAKAFGLNAKETAAFLGVLSNNGFDASSAATALRNILLNLSDANGKLSKGIGHSARSFDEIIDAFKELQEKGVNVGDVLSMTDKRSAAAAATMITQADAVRQLKEKLDDANGSLRKMADTMHDNLNGSLKNLKSAWEGFILSLDESKGPMKAVVDFLTTVLNRITDIISKTEKVTWWEAFLGPVIGGYIASRHGIKNGGTPNGGAYGGGEGGGERGGTGTPETTKPKLTPEEIKALQEARAAAKAAEQARWESSIEAESFLLEDALSKTGSLKLPNLATVQVPTQLTKPDNVEEWEWDVVGSIGEIHVGVHLDMDKRKIIDITNEVNSALQDLAASTGEVIGQLVGDLVTGGDAWQNFSNAALSAFGDMAIAIGKIAIETGIARLGIEAAITALGPEGAAMAIAAGTALVALGAAVKTGLSNVAAGDYSGGVSVASANYGSYNSDYSTREVTVNVTGTLKADGDQLVAVITNTQNNSYYQT